MTADPLAILPVTRTDARGSLSILTGLQELPFAFARLFWVHGVTAGVARGSHAHRVQHQALICMAGVLDVLIEDGGASQRTVRLERPEQVLHLPPLTWSQQTPVVDGTVYAVIASGPYDADDYIHDKEVWMRSRKAGGCFTGP